MFKLISIVVITFNSADHIESCLDSIYCQPFENMEVVVVDNGSTDGTKELIRKKYQQAKLIENSNNFGVCKARNQGIDCLTGEWVLVVDSDVVLGNGFIDGFIEAQNRFTDDIGMVQSNILDIEGRTIYSNGIYLSFWRRFYDVNRGKDNIAVDSYANNIIGPCAAAAFYRRSMLEHIKERTGYFDERFFFLVEDVDLAWRAKRHGWRVIFCPEIKCRHAGNGSKTDRSLRQYLSFRNRHWMILKNESIRGRFVVYFISFPYEFIRLIYLFIFNKYMWKKVV